MTGDGEGALAAGTAEEPGIRAITVPSAPGAMGGGPGVLAVEGVYGSAGGRGGRPPLVVLPTGGAGVADVPVMSGFP